MRRVGLLDAVDGMRSGDHACWVQRSPVDLTVVLAQAVEGARRDGDRLTVFGSRSAEQLLDEVLPLDGADDLDRRGALQAVSYRDLPLGGHADRPEVYLALADAAVDDGFTSMRAVAQATDLVLDTTDRSTYVGLEHETDRRLATAPMSCVCVYDETALGPVAVDELAAVHPLVRSPVGMQVFGTAHGTIGLAGDLDASSVALLTATLDRLPPPRQGSQLVLDARLVDHVDHRSMFAIDRFAADRQVTVTLAEAPPSAVRLARLVPPVHVRVEGRS